MFMLCTVHIKNNFKKNCFKGLSSNVDKHKSLLKAVDRLTRSEDDVLFNEAKDKFLLIAKTSTIADDITNYFKRYVLDAIDNN